jgi:phospholipid/cholesterol/gamma-HCH transport system substrate-binding protein
MLPRFREVNSLTMAISGLAAAVLAVLGAFQVPKLPFIAGHTYHAEFADAAGMEVGDFVEVAGVHVGKVTDLEIQGNRILATFTVKNVRLGDQTRAAIKTGTLLGTRFLGLDPHGRVEMRGGDTIPASRTETPYNIDQTLEQLTSQVHDFDKPQMQAALNTFADAFAHTPGDFRATLTNVKSLSDTISSRNDSLHDLLAHANGFTQVLNDRTAQFQQLFRDGNALLDELNRRKQVLDQMLDSFTYVTGEANRFVHENNKDLGPELDHLNTTMDTIRRNDLAIQKSVETVSSFLSGLGEGVASGPRFTADLHDIPGVFNYTDVLRVMESPQIPVLPAAPGLPGLGRLPNPLPDDRAVPPPTGGAAAPNLPAIPGLGGH